MNHCNCVHVSMDFSTQYYHFWLYRSVSLQCSSCIKVLQNVSWSTKFIHVSWLPKFAIFGLFSMHVWTLKPMLESSKPYFTLLMACEFGKLSDMPVSMYKCGTTISFFLSKFVIYCFRIKILKLTYTRCTCMLGPYWSAVGESQTYHLGILLLFMIKNIFLLFKVYEVNYSVDLLNCELKTLMTFLQGTNGQEHISFHK